MATIDLGKIRLAWRGDYDPETAYRPLDMVRFERDLFICIKAPDAPGTDPASAQHWALMVERNGFFWRGTWDEAIPYKRNDAAFHGRSSYFCITDAPAGTLPTDTDHWTLLAEGTSITVDPGDLIFRDADDVEKPLPVGAPGQALIVQDDGLPGYGEIDLRKRSQFAAPITAPPFTTPTAGQLIGTTKYRAAVGTPTLFWESHGHNWQYIMGDQTREYGSGNWTSWLTSSGNYMPTDIQNLGWSGGNGGFPQYDNWYYMHGPAQGQNHGQRTGAWSGHSGYRYKVPATPGMHNRVFVNFCTGNGWWWGVFPFLLDPRNGYTIVKRLPAMHPQTWSNSYPTCSLQLTPFGQMQYSQNTGNIWCHFDVRADLVAQYADDDGYLHFGVAIHTSSTDTTYVRMAGVACTPVHDPGVVTEGYGIYYGLNGWWQSEWVWWGHAASQFACVQCENNRYPGNTVRYLYAPVFDPTKDLLLTLMALNNKYSAAGYQSYGEPSLQMIPQHPNTGANNSYRYIARAGWFKSGPTLDQLEAWGVLQPFQYVIPKEVVQECLGQGGHGVDDVIRLQCSTYCGSSGFVMVGYWAQPLEV
jgi:hypothetical protein